MDQHFSIIKTILAEEERKCEELKQLVEYYKKRNECLELDLAEMADHLEKEKELTNILITTHKSEEQPKKRQRI
jgi:hypothetical protein